MITMPKIFCRNTFEAQCSQFRNGVVLAVAGTTRKRCDRRRPDILLTMLCKVACCTDREIDGAISLAEPGAAAAAAGAVDNRQKPECRRRDATVAISIT